MSLTVDEIHVADAPDAWARAGFTVDSAGDAAPCCRVGGVRIRLVGSHHGSGIVGWSLGGLPAGFSGELDGIATARSDDCGAATASTPTEVNPAASASTSTHAPRAAPAEHSNGVTAIDHVVLLSPDPIAPWRPWRLSANTLAGNAAENSADSRSGRSFSGSVR